MNHFRAILKLANPYRKFVWLNVLFNVLYAVFNVLSVFSFIPILGILFGQEERVYKKPVYNGIFKLFDYLKESLNYKVTHLIETEGIEKALLFICVLSFTLFFLKNLFRYFASFILVFLRTNVVKDLRDKLYTKIVELPISYFSEKRKGDTIARMTTDVYEVEESFLTSLETIVREPLTIILTLASMLAISLKLTIFVFVLLPISGFIISFISKKLKAKSIKAQNEVGLFLSFIEETLTGLKVIKGFNAENSITKKFLNSTSKFKNLMTNVLHKQSLASPMSEFLGSTTIILILWFGGKMVLSESSTMNPQDFFGYIGLFYLVLNPAKAISVAFYKIQKGNASAGRIMEILNIENSALDSKNTIVKTDFTDKIVFKNIYFKYKDEYVLKNFSFTLKKGEKIALVGQSGSGKTTLANLIARFYDVEKGEILIDGVNIKNITQKSLRDLMGIVTQDLILFNDTVENNIKLGMENANFSQVKAASKIANSYEFIKNLPSQFKTIIGDGGNTLSGGQKQRLSIARAILKNPPIMILDEATSSLDTESEKLVQAALDKMMKNRTSLIIAHRLSTIQKADNIIVMKKGEIVEQGKHDKLLAKKGEYYKLVTMQSFG